MFFIRPISFFPWKLEISVPLYCFWKCKNIHHFVSRQIFFCKDEDIPMKSSSEIDHDSDISKSYSSDSQSDKIESEENYYSLNSEESGSDFNDSNDSSTNKSKEDYGSELKLIFSFDVDFKTRESKVKTQIQRVLDHVSFSLAFDLDLSITESKLVSKEYNDFDTIYVFKFNDLNSAIEWMKSPSVQVGPERKNGDFLKIQSNQNAIMRKYESSGKLKKRKIVDEDGFMYYG